MKFISFIIFYFCSICFVYSQSNSEQNKTYNFSANVGIGINKFAITGWETEDYPSLVTRLGFGVSRNVIGDRVQLQTGMNFYFRAKSKSPLVDEIYWYGKGSRLPLLDETATQRHIAIEIPLTIKYLLSGNRSLNTGLIIRRYGPKKPREINLLASQTEVGYSIGISQNVIKNFNIGLDFFIGFKDFYPVATIGSSVDIQVKNRSALFSVAYVF